MLSRTWAAFPRPPAPFHPCPPPPPESLQSNPRTPRGDAAALLSPSDNDTRPAPATFHTDLRQSLPHCGSSPTADSPAPRTSPRDPSLSRVSLSRPPAHTCPWSAAGPGPAAPTWPPRAPRPRQRRPRGGRGRSEEPEPPSRRAPTWAGRALRGPGPRCRALRRGGGGADASVR